MTEDNGPSLPDMVFNLELLTLNVNARKHCTCYETRIEVDSVNRLVHCGQCGAVLDPFDALLRLARDHQSFRSEIDRLLQQRREIASYKPWLVTFKKLEQRYRRKQYVPTCPKCKGAFELDELLGVPWVNRDYVDLQNDLKQVNGGDT